MKVIDVFSCYYGAACTANGRDRHAAKVCLTATSDAGQITYEVGVTFFPHDDPEDFGISYDAASSRVIYDAKGRRSKKKEKDFLADLQKEADSLAEEWNAEIFWDQALREPRYG